ncbi:hypothetical protein Cpir12675_006284 [Ceratocystis pirilliformis]|uniref:Uncharacterized protein n=1 Tax=Ceratocystis pirilliformis TaxID=259994 RepID=A0ABR3YIH6_9PEZI
MWVSSWISFGLVLSYFRNHGSIHSSNDQPTWDTEIEAAEALEISQTTEFQPSHNLAASTLEGLVSLESHGYTDVDLHGGIIGVISERYSQNNGLVLELYIDTETQVLTIFQDNLQIEEGETDNLQLHEIIQALFLKRNMDINKVKWAAANIDEPLARMASRDYRKKNGLGPTKDIKIAAADPSWPTFSSTRSYESTSQIVPGAQIDRMVVANSRPLDSDKEDPPTSSVMLMLSFKMPSDDDSAPIDVIDEHTAQLAAEGNLWEGLNAAVGALNIHLNYIQKISTDFNEDALEAPSEAISDPVSLAA